MRLYIAEKPSMAREIARVLKNPQQGVGYIKTAGGIVTWLVGHVLKQVDPAFYDAKYQSWRMEDLPIIPAKWQLEVDPHTAEQFNIVKRLIATSNIDEIVHAGDPDREGQLLVDEVLDFVGNKKPVKRILLNALDETSIIRANSNLRDKLKTVRTCKKSRRLAYWNESFTRLHFSCTKTWTSRSSSDRQSKNSDACTCCAP